MVATGLQVVKPSLVKIAEQTSYTQELSVSLFQPKTKTAHSPVEAIGDALSVLSDPSQTNEKKRVDALDTLRENFRLISSIDVNQGQSFLLYIARGFSTGFPTGLEETAAQAAAAEFMNIAENPSFPQRDRVDAGWDGAPRISTVSGGFEMHPKNTLATQMLLLGTRQSQHPLASKLAQTLESYADAPRIEIDRNDPLFAALK